jgi:hypothetical protein
MKARKPKCIEVDKAYRLNAVYGLGAPSDVVVYVTAIEGNKQRIVRVREVTDYGLGWSADNYSSFLRKVHSEVETDVWFAPRTTPTKTELKSQENA